MDDLLDRARAGDTDAFEKLITGHRRELGAHAYRMLGSFSDAEDAVQETMLAAWRGLGTFAGRSSLRTWLYRICTHVCLRQAERSRSRHLTADLVPSRTETGDLGEPLAGPWIEPSPTAEDAVLAREGVELAWVAALQHLAPLQRATLVLREVLEFPAAEVADMLQTSVAAINSALQRARATMRGRATRDSQRAELDALGDEGVRRLTRDFVRAWQAADIDAIAELLAEDVRLSMPPLPAWFDGRDAVLDFFVDRIFATAWRLLPIEANGQLAFACYQEDPRGATTLGTLSVLDLRHGRIHSITSFCDPASFSSFGLSDHL